MKRQVEDLFFKYKGQPSQQSTDSITFNLPDDYEPFPGDIIEMIVSENQTKGYVSYYAKLICYSDAENQINDIEIEALDGKLEDAVATTIPLESSLYIKNEEHKKSVQLNTSSGHAVLFDNGANYTVNLIVHRTKGDVGLYFL